MYSMNADTKFIPVIESLISNAMEVVCNQINDCTECEYGEDTVCPECLKDFRYEMIQELVKQYGEDEVRKYEIS